MIKRATIARVYKNTHKMKDGVKGDAYIYKNGANAGKNFVRVGIKTDVTGEDTYYANVLPSDRIMNIEVNQKLVLKFTDDGQFKNFTYPSKKDLEDFALNGE